MLNYRFTIFIRQDFSRYNIVDIISRLIYKGRVPDMASFLIYCYIVDSGSYLENKDNHQTKHNRKSIFKEKGTLYFVVILEKKNTLS